MANSEAAGTGGAVWTTAKFPRTDIVHFSQSGLRGLLEGWKMRESWIHRSAVIAASLAMAAGLSVSPASAEASRDSDMSFASPLADSHCGMGGQGYFYHTGDWFNIADLCIDGRSAVLLVDAYPYRSGSGFDFAVWASGGSGTSGDTQHNLPEGTRVVVRACIGQKADGASAASHCGNWEEGVA